MAKEKNFLKFNLIKLIKLNQIESNFIFIKYFTYFITKTAYKYFTYMYIYTNVDNK